MANQFVLIPRLREIPLGHTIIGPSPDPSDVVEFDAPSLSAHPLPEPHDYPVVLKADSKELESIALHARGDERVFISLCRRCNVTPSWWNEAAYNYRLLTWKFKTTTVNIKDLADGVMKNAVQIQGETSEEIGPDFPLYVSIGGDRRVFVRRSKISDGTVCYERKCSGATVEIGLHPKERSTKMAMKVVRYCGDPVEGDFRVRPATKKQWLESDRD